jgi:transcriptional regulator with XRE-family HTH domain
MKVILEDQNLTVTDLKSILSVTYEMARRYTLGTAKPRDTKLRILGDTYGYSLGWLSHGDGEKYAKRIPLIDELREKGQDYNYYKEMIKVHSVTAIDLINEIKELDKKKSNSEEILQSLLVLVKNL